MFSAPIETFIFYFPEKDDTKDYEIRRVEVGPSSMYSKCQIDNLRLDDETIGRNYFEGAHVSSADVEVMKLL